MWSCTCTFDLLLVLNHGLTRPLVSWFIFFSLFLVHSTGNNTNVVRSHSFLCFLPFEDPIFGCLVFFLFFFLLCLPLPSFVFLFAIITKVCLLGHYSRFWRFPFLVISRILTSSLFSVPRSAGPCCCPCLQCMKKCAFLIIRQAEMGEELLRVIHLFLPGSLFFFFFFFIVSVFFPIHNFLCSVG